MKKFLTALCLALVLPWMNLSARNVNVTELTSLIRQYKNCDNFDSMTIGGLGLSFLRNLAKSDTHGDPDTIAALSLLKGLSQIVICDYEDCSANVKESFTKKVSNSLESCDVLMDAKSQGESMIVYGDVSNDGSQIRNVVLFSPENCALILLTGKVSQDDLSDAIKGMDE